MGLKRGGIMGWNGGPSLGRAIACSSVHFFKLVIPVTCGDAQAFAGMGALPQGSPFRARSQRPVCTGGLSMDRSITIG